MGKLKEKPKTQSRAGKKSRPSSGRKQHLVDEAPLPELAPTLPQERRHLFFQHKKYWLLAILLVVAAGLIWWLSQTWLAQSYFSGGKTYTGVVVLGEHVGNLDADKLDRQLAQLKSEFDARGITLVNGKDRWAFNSKKLGITFDTNSTRQSVLKVNHLKLIDKVKLQTGSANLVVAPTISINTTECVKALSVIPATQTAPVDASVYFDNGLKIKSDQQGTKFNADLTCRELPKQLANNTFVSNVHLETFSATLTKADLEPKLAQVISIAGESLALNGGSYHQNLTSEQLFALLEITKEGKEVKINWSSAKLDEIINGIAGKVNTYSGASALGACQYVSSNGGYWLDKGATKKIFTDLSDGKPRSYNLPISYHEPVIGSRTPVAPGNSGTVYLTFDDGMTYGDQIMNYASCYGVKVTFFEIGERASGDAVALRRAIAEGHSVQSHGHYHAIYDYGDRTYDWQYNDMAQSITDIMGVTGVRPTYFRPPGGNRSATTYTAANANGLKLILWGATSADATAGGISSSQTCSNVLARVFPGASVLMHSTHSSTAAAFPCIVEGLAARGYSMQALR